MKRTDKRGERQPGGDPFGDASPPSMPPAPSWLGGIQDVFARLSWSPWHPQSKPPAMPGLLADEGAFARWQGAHRRWRGGTGRRGHRGALKRALIAMLDTMDDRSAKAVLGEFIADARGAENVLTGLREDRQTDLRIVDVDDQDRVHFEADGRRRCVTWRRIENILSDVRRHRR